jgi:hypothetical protein
MVAIAPLGYRGWRGIFARSPPTAVKFAEFWLRGPVLSSLPQTRARLGAAQKNSAAGDAALNITTKGGWRSAESNWVGASAY